MERTRNKEGGKKNGREQGTRMGAESIGGSKEQGSEQRTLEERRNKKGAESMGRSKEQGRKEARNIGGSVEHQGHKRELKQYPCVLIV